MLKLRYEKPYSHRQKKSVSHLRFEDERKNGGCVHPRRSCVILVCERAVFRLCVLARAVLRPRFRTAKHTCRIALLHRRKRRFYARLAYASVCACPRRDTRRAVCDFLQIPQKRAPLVDCPLCACRYDSLRCVRLRFRRQLFKIRTVGVVCNSDDVLLWHLRVCGVRALYSAQGNR